jgi:hypothetical protein
MSALPLTVEGLLGKMVSTTTIFNRHEKVSSYGSVVAPFEGFLNLDLWIGV